MKKLVGLLSLLVFGSVYSQDADTSLEYQFKLNLGTQGADLAIELPVANKIAIDVATGFGGYNKARNFEDGYELGNKLGLAYYAKTEAKYYFSRVRRARKGNDLGNNAGSFLALQAKFNNNNADYGKILLKEIHFGQQLPVGENFLFCYHVGLGHISNLDYSYNKVMPTIGLKMAYVLDVF